MTRSVVALLLITGLLHAQPVLHIDTPVSPPTWALLQRQLLQANAEACREYFARYFDERGWLMCVERWGGDEGIRFYFDDDRLSWGIVRPSGTGNALRLHVQLYSPVNEQGLVAKKGELMRQAKEVMDVLRERLGAPRE